MTIPPSGVKTICQRVGSPAPASITPVYVTQLGASSHSVPDLYAYPTHMNLKSLEQMSRPSLKRAQEDDEVIEPAIQALKQGHWPEASTNPDLLRLKRETGKLSLKDGLLYRISKKQSGEELTS